MGQRTGCGDLSPNPENSILVSISLRRRLMPVPGLLTRPAPCILVDQASPRCNSGASRLTWSGESKLGSLLRSRVIMVRPLARRNGLIPSGPGGIPKPFPLSFSVRWQGILYEGRDLELPSPADVVLVALGWPARLRSGLGGLWKDCITSPQDPGMERRVGPACLWGCSNPGYGTTAATSRALCPLGQCTAGTSCLCERCDAGRGELPWPG